VIKTIAQHAEAAFAELIAVNDGSIPQNVDLFYCLLGVDSTG
jgi:hypothetical protein